MNKGFMERSEYKPYCELNPAPFYFGETLRSKKMRGKFGHITYVHYRSISDDLI